MVVMEWIDTIIAFLAVSSALLLALGVLSYLVVRLLKIRGKPNLWIYTMLMLMPLIYPVHTFLPDAISVSIPMLTATSPISEPVFAGSAETALPDAGIVHRSSPATPARAAISESGSTSGHPVPWKLIVALAWIFPLLFFLFRTLLMAYNTGRLARHAEPVNDPAVLELLRQCADETGVRKTPLLRMADPLSTPMVMGILRPIILIPEHLLAEPFQDGLRFTLLHELKHLKRRDNWWLLVESFVGAVYFFHPVIHWARKRIHEEWEYLCDHHVIRITRKSASYADFLLHEVWNHGQGSLRPAIAVPFIVPGVSKTARRVRSILGNNTPTFVAKLRGRIGVGVVLVAFLSVLAFSAAPSVREETAIAAPIDPRLTALPGETAQIPELLETEAVLTEPTDDGTALVPVPPVPTPSRTFSIGSSRTAGETRQATSTTPAIYGGPSTGEVTPKNSAEEETEAAAIDTRPTALPEGTAQASAVSETDTEVNQLPTNEVALAPTLSAPTPLLAASADRSLSTGETHRVKPADPPASMLLAENDTPQPEKQTRAVETVPAAPDTAADKYSRLESQLEEVSDISSFNLMNWDAVDNRTFILQTSPNRYYLILLRRRAHGLKFAETIAISNTGNMVRPGFDRVTVFSPFQKEDYIIHKIFKLKDRQEAKQIRDQLG